MNDSMQDLKTNPINPIEFKYLMFEYQSDEHMVTLVDAEGFKITRGYGQSISEAINDLHHNLI